jgi:hypothetical protein
MKLLNRCDVWMQLESTLGLLHTKSKIIKFKPILLDHHISTTQLLEVQGLGGSITFQKGT